MEAIRGLPLAYTQRAVTPRDQHTRFSFGLNDLAQLVSHDFASQRLRRDAGSRTLSILSTALIPKSFPAKTSCKRKALRTPYYPLVGARACVLPCSSASAITAPIWAVGGQHRLFEMVNLVV